MTKAKCPYCKKEYELDLTNDYNVFGECYEIEECAHCGKEFMLSFIVDITTDSQPALCLIGESEHKYEPTTTVPIMCTRMCCTMCGAEHLPTRAEWLKILENKEETIADIPEGRIREVK